MIAIRLGKFASVVGLIFPIVAFSEVVNAQELIRPDQLNVSTTLKTGEPRSENDQRPIHEFMPTADAIRLFESRISLNPKDHFSMVVAAQLYLREGREKSSHLSLEKAESLLRKAIEISPTNQGAHSWLISALVSQHKFREGVAQSDQALKLAPGNKFILSSRADALLELGRVDEAEAIFSEIAKSVRTPGVLARLARVAELRGKPDDAVRLVSEALEESIKHEERPQTTAWYEYRLGVLFLDQGKLDQAAEYFQKGITRSPNDSRLVNGLARVRVAEGKLFEARKLYEKSVWKENSPTVMAEYADLLRRMGQTAEAAKWLNSADELMVRESATTGTSHFRDRALFLLNHNRNVDLALDLAKKDLQVRQDIFAHQTLAWAQFKAGNVTAAMEEITTAMALGTRDASIYFHASEIARANKQLALADQWLEQARKINPYASCLKQ
ncbi:MAG: tetratricopeptide repeat protein [Pirellulaceae bacterium]